MPHPASNTPSGMRTGIGFLSENMPKSGCTIDELTVAANTSAPAAASEIPRSAVRKGTSAATAPWLRSVKRWPADNPAIALRSTPFLETSLKSRFLPARGPQAQMLSAFPNFVRREQPCAARAELGYGPPRRSHHLHDGLPGLARGGPSTAGWGNFEQNLGQVPMYAAELPGLAQRLPEAPDLVHQPELERLLSGPHPATGDALQVFGVDAAPPRDAILELAVDPLDLAFDYPALLVVGAAAGIQEAGARSPVDRDGVDAQLLVEAAGDGPDGQHAYGAGNRAATGDDVARGNRDVVAAGRRGVSHQYHHGFLRVRAPILARVRSRGQRAGFGEISVNQDGGHRGVLLLEPQCRHNGLTPRLLPARERERNGQPPAPPPGYGPGQAYQRDLPLAPFAVRNTERPPRSGPLDESGAPALEPQPARQLVFVEHAVDEPLRERL